MKKSDYLSIGDMAAINQTTISTLRLYDRLGILKPYYTDGTSHYRYYDIKQNARLDMILYMKELGMELREIKQVFDKQDINLIESVLIRKREQTAEAIERLKVQQEGIDRTISSIERYRKSPGKGMLTLEYLPKRKVYTMVTDINFYDHDIDTYEMILKQLKNSLISRNLPQVYYCNAGTYLTLDNFISQNFVSNKIFVFVDDHFPKDERTEIIDDGMYACIYTDDFDSETEYAGRLLDYCRSRDYTPSGDYICEVLTELNVFDCGKRSMYLRLQVPVTFREPV